MAFTEGTNYYTEFSGERKLLYVEMSPDSASGNVSIGEFDNAVPIGYVFTEALASTCLQLYAEQNADTANQVDIVLYNSDGGAATTFLDFRLAIIVWNSP